MREYSRIEYNKLCAEFLGYTNTTPTDPDFSIYENEKGITVKGRLYKLLEPMSMEFDSDWNWIMEVLLKAYSVLPPSSDTRQDLIRRAGSGSKEATVLAIWNFLNWYNENTRIRSNNIDQAGRKLP